MRNESIINIIEKINKEAKIVDIENIIILRTWI